MPLYDLKRLREGLRPFRLHWFSRLRSTNDHSAVMRGQNRLFAPAVVLTGRQTAGRGRGLNRWWSASGSITATFVLPVEEHLAPHQVAIAAGLAVRNALAEVSGVERLGLKWPNDLVWDGRKLGGVLCERLAGVDLIGVGINVNTDIARAPRKLRRKISSMAEATDRSLDLTGTLIAVAQHLRAVAARRRHAPFPAVVREYEKYHVLTGLIVTCSTVGGVINGICRGIDDAGRLVIDANGSEMALMSASVLWP